VEGWGGRPGRRRGAHGRPRRGAVAARLRPGPSRSAAILVLAGGALVALGGVAWSAGGGGSPAASAQLLTPREPALLGVLERQQPTGAGGPTATRDDAGAAQVGPTTTVTITPPTPPTVPVGSGATSTTATGSVGRLPDTGVLAGVIAGGGTALIVAGVALSAASPRVRSWARSPAPRRAGGAGRRPQRGGVRRR
jgi:hypothetical protein